MSAMAHELYIVSISSTWYCNDERVDVLNSRSHSLERAILFQDQYYEVVHYCLRKLLIWDGVFVAGRQLRHDGNQG